METIEEGLLSFYDVWEKQIESSMSAFIPEWAILESVQKSSVSREQDSISFESEGNKKELESDEEYILGSNDLKAGADLKKTKKKVVNSRDRILLNRRVKSLPNWIRLLVLLLLFGSAKGDCHYGKAAECPLFRPVEKSTALYEGSAKVGHLKNNTKDYVLKLHIFASSQPYNCENASEAHPEQTCKVALWKNATCPGFSLVRDGKRIAVMKQNVTEAFGYCSFIFGPDDYHVDQGGVILESKPPSSPNDDETKVGWIVAVVLLSLAGAGLVIGLAVIIKKKREYKRAQVSAVQSALRTVLVYTDNPQTRKSSRESGADELPRSRSSTF